MKPILSTLILFVLVISSTNLSAQKLNEKESKLLNETFKAERGEFDFSGKTAGFFWATRLWNKDEFFKDLKESIKSGHSMSLQFILLTNEQKEKSDGYDVFIYSWSKFLISKKQVGAHINKIKKNKSQQGL